MNQVQTLLNQVPPEAVRILLVLFLSFLLGTRAGGAEGTAGHYMFGGVRTFPLLGLMGYGAGADLRTQLSSWRSGLLAVSAFMVVSYWHKLENSEDAGITTEITGLLTYVLGALVYYGNYWFASTLVVVTMLLLELKVVAGEPVGAHLPEEVTAFTKFLLLTPVILPMVPNQDFGPFHINPFKTWLVVVAVSGISYGSYVLQRVTGSAAASSWRRSWAGPTLRTIMTVVLARRAKRENRPHLFPAASSWPRG